MTETDPQMLSVYLFFFILAPQLENVRRQLGVSLTDVGVKKKN